MSWFKVPGQGCPITVMPCRNNLDCDNHLDRMINTGQNECMPLRTARTTGLGWTGGLSTIQNLPSGNVACGTDGMCKIIEVFKCRSDTEDLRIGVL